MLLDKGEVTLAMQINAGFADDLRSGRQAVIQSMVDGTDSNTGHGGDGLRPADQRRVLQGAQRAAG